MTTSCRLKPPVSSRHRACCALLLAGLAIAAPATAGGSDLGQAAGAAAGVYAAIWVHEAGHAAAAHAAGARDVHISVPGAQCKLLCGQTSFKFDRYTDAGSARMISIAGLVTSNLVSNALLHHDSGARSGFGQGFVATNLYSNATSVLSYYTKVRGRNGYRGNDIDNYELAGGNPHLLSAGLIAYSAYALHRMRKKNIPVLFVQLRF